MTALPPARLAALPGKNSCFRNGRPRVWNEINNQNSNTPRRSHSGAVVSCSSRLTQASQYSFPATNDSLAQIKVNMQLFSSSLHLHARARLLVDIGGLGGIDELVGIDGLVGSNESGGIGPGGLGGISGLVGIAGWRATDDLTAAMDRLARSHMRS